MISRGLKFGDRKTIKSYDFSARLSIIRNTTSSKIWMAENIYPIYNFIQLISHEECRIFRKVSMITNVILILYHSSMNKKLILRDLCFRHHISCLCSISPTKMIPNTATVLFCVWATQQGFVPEWINRLNDSVQSQRLACCRNATCWWF